MHLSFCWAVVRTHLQLICGQLGAFLPSSCSVRRTCLATLMQRNSQPYFVLWARLPVQTGHNTSRSLITVHLNSSLSKISLCCLRPRHPSRLISSPRHCGTIHYVACVRQRHCNTTTSALAHFPHRRLNFPAPHRLWLQCLSPIQNRRRRRRMLR